MANDSNDRKINDLADRSSMLAYGMDSTLEKENTTVKNVIQQTIIDTKAKLGERTNGNPIDYFNEINFGKAFDSVIVQKGSSTKKDQTDAEQSANFKKMMETAPGLNVSNLLLGDETRTLKFNNYRIIKEYIPECAQALEIYKDNIMSPDDFTKIIFNTIYDSNKNDKVKELVEDRLHDITLKYELEDKTDKIIDQTLTLGESYVAVLSLEDEFSTMLPSGATDYNGMQNFAPINESSMIDNAKTRDPNCVSYNILKEDVNLNNDEIDALREGFSESDKVTDDELREYVADLINNNVEIGSPAQLLLERAEADYDSRKNVDIDPSFYKKSKGVSKKADNKPLYVNGSAMRILDPSRVVELKVDNVCYGYYYAEDYAAFNSIPGSTYLGVNNGRDQRATMNLASGVAVETGTSRDINSFNPAGNYSDEKLKLISNLFVNQLAKKLDKDYIRKNKEFKDFIYELVRQNYILKRGLRLTYFKPDEVIKFEAKPIYEDIVFFAKLYLGILTNNTIIKMGRAHEKRIFYVNVGADAQYEQAINTVIQDIKTKEYKMDGLDDFNTILNLNPGRFDDYFMPTVNGERPIEIETLPGMDVDMNNEFVEYLKNSMMSGMGVPRNLIDTTSEVDFARNISAMNANFVRSVIRYQKKFTPSFTRLYQRLYTNEYKFVNDQEDTNTLVDIKNIRVEFPSPASLAMTNISDMIQSADNNADFIASQILPPKQDGSTEDQRVKLKSKIVKDLMPGIDWNKYEEYANQLKREDVKDAIKNSQDPATMQQDPYGIGGQM